MVELDVADVRGVLRIGRARARHAPALARRFVEIARRHRPLHGNVGAAGVQVRPAEVVVRVPRIGGQRNHDAFAGRGAHDKERVVAAHLLSDVDLHDDLVVAGAPRAVDGERERGGPAAALRRCVLRCLVLVDRDAGRRRAEQHLASRADPRHLDAHRPPTGRRHVQADLLARDNRLRPAIPRHHFARHRMTLTGLAVPQ